MKCPKCRAISGDDWSQCNGACPMPGSPHYVKKVYSTIPKERGMTLLRTEIGWKRWLRNVVCIDAIDIKTLSGCASEVPVFPCYGFTQVRSFGYEELAPVYLSFDDCARMTGDLARAGATE